MSGAGMLLAVAFGSTATQIKSLKARKPDGQSITEVIQAADRLYDSNKMKEALAYLERHSESKDAEVLWRLARLCYKVSSFYHVWCQLAHYTTPGGQISLRGLDTGTGHGREGS